ncbi:MAG TPA: DUF58 domain-containing protein [Candidatus Saccharimonadales bacterium]|nr:DUF58 domain-containing protein [Candidatus Saccharimonadales bacterium]
MTADATLPQARRPGSTGGTAARGTVAGVLLLIGSLTGSPAIVVLGLVGMLMTAIHAIWARHGLRAVEYRRILPSRRAVWGDELDVAISVWNRKRLPLAWLEAEDTLHPALPIRERTLGPDERPDRFVNTWTLGSYERVVRHYHILAERRGVFELGPTRLRVGDLFGNQAAEEERTARDAFLVRPRIVPVRERFVRQRWDGELRARQGLLENPSLFSGVREYRAGDSLRRVHWKATARLGQPVSRRFDPARERDVMLALDIQNSGRRGAATSLGEDDSVEALCVAAASLARSFERSGRSFGLAAAGFSGSIRPFAYIAPSEAVGQLGRVLDILARLSAVPSAEFQQLLTALVRILRPGATILVLSGRPPVPYLPALRRLARSGFPVLLVAFGRDAGVNAATARRAGITARVAELEGSWRTSPELVLAG